MKAIEFCYWLQGYFEIHSEVAGKFGMSKNQVEMVKKHLALVFKHEIDPSYGDEQYQQELNDMHSCGDSRFG